MKIKNKMYYPIEAVLEDRSVVKFMPNEVREIDDPFNVKRLVEERYPDELMIVEEPREVSSTIEKDEFKCPYCDVVAKSKAGLSSHVRIVHKPIPPVASQK